MLDQHVRYYLRHHPQEAQRHMVVRRDIGVYEIDGHQVEIEWQHAPEPGQPGHLVVVDGPMRQPFADYLEMGEKNAEYDTHAIAKTSALHHVPKERRMTFDDTHKKYTRLEAMKVAKEQASIREKAADYTRDGRQVPDELVRKYNKALRQKLRGKVRDEESPPARSGRREPAPSASGKPDAAAVQQQPVPEPACGPPVVALMAHRGISLNGLPSYMPPQAAAFSGISRSWSGTNMQGPGMPPALAPPALFAVPGMAVPAQVAQVTGTSPMASVCLCPAGSSAQQPQHAVAVAAVPVGYYR